MRMTLTELEQWGRKLGAAASPPLLLAISGDLGAGKTTLAQAVCAGFGVTDEVTSPTFALVHEYSAPRAPVFHLDLYRLEKPDDLTNVAWDDIVLERALVIVEWPERAGDRLPADALHIALEHAPDDPSRRVLLAG